MDEMIELFIQWFVYPLVFGIAFYLAVCIGLDLIGAAWKLVL